MTDSPNTSWPSSTTKNRHDAGLLEADRLASQIRDRWRRDGQPDVAAAIAEYPKLQGYRSVVLDLAYEEYCWRRKAGETLDADAFSRRFPTLQRSLCLLIHVHGLLDHDPAFQGLEDLAAWPQPGESFLGFRLLAELGRGAFGRVFLAHEPALGNREVAVKIALQGGQEAQVLGRMQHPNIVPVHSVQEDPRTCLTAFCMPYLGRATLCDVLDRVFSGGILPTRASVILDAVRAVHDDIDFSAVPLADRILRSGPYVEGVAHLGAQLAEALAHAHSRGVCHRDLKPSNVLLSPEGRPLLLDFNLSVDRGLAPSKVGGTLPYMAPEQLAIVAHGDGGHPWHYDPRSDLFSLGVILYELWSGVLPFGGMPMGRTVEELASVLRERQLRGPRPLEEHGAQADRRLARLIEACLASDPEQRPQTADQLAAALRRELSPPRRARRWVRSHRRPLAAAGCALLVLVIALAGALALRPPYSVRQFQRGLEYSQHGEFATAEACFTEALRSDPQNSEVLVARADALSRLGDFRMAFEDYRAVYQSAHDPALAAKMGYCMSKLHQHQDAFACYGAALKGGFTSPALLNNIGFALLKLGQIEEAEKYLRQALERNADLGPGYHSLVVVLLNRARRGQPLSQEAIDCAKRAAELCPPSADLYSNVAALFALAARDDASLVRPAIEYLDKGVTCGLDPRTLRGAGTFTVLRGNEAFEVLLTKKSSSPPVRAANYLVEP